MKLRSTFASVALAATLPLGAAPFLVGCGGGGSAAQSASSDFASRGIALGNARTGELTLTVRSDRSVSGTLSIADPTRKAHRAVFQAALTGTRDDQSFTVTGSYRDGQADTSVRIAGTLPPASGTGGAFTITLGDASFSGAFGTTPTPTPSPSPTPAPTGKIGDYLPALAPGDALQYRRNTTTTLTLNGTPQAPRTTTAGYTTTRSDCFLDEGIGGARTTSTLDGATVTREESLDANGAVTGYLYYTQDADGYRIYGRDTLENGVVTDSLRYSPAQQVRNLAPGQSDVQTYTVTLTDATGTHTIQESHNRQFVSVTDSVTVPAGTFSACARIRVQVANTYSQDGQAVAFASDRTTWYARGIGAVKSDMRLDTQSGTSFRSRVESESSLQSGQIGSRTLP